MDPNTAVNTSAAISLVGFGIVIFLLLFLIAKWKWHVFFALLIPIIFFGILPGIQQNNFIDAFESGFGNTLGSIGVVIDCFPNFFHTTSRSTRCFIVNDAYSLDGFFFVFAQFLLDN